MRVAAEDVGALDGRLARLGGHESAFGREFDSLADIVSFGVAPALMVYRIVLQEFPRACWIIALHPHVVEYPRPAKALSERIGTALTQLPSGRPR